MTGSVALVHPRGENTHAQGGRPRVYEHRAIAQALWQGRGSIADAAKILKCSPQTVWEALELTPMLREIVSDCDGLIFDIAYQTLCHYSTDDLRGDWTEADAGGDYVAV